MNQYTNSINNTSVKLQLVENKGNIEACKRCSGHDCCGKIRKGGSIEPPFLTAEDIIKIKYYSGLNKEQFSESRINPITNNIINVIKTLHNGGCIFFSKGNGKCQIHSFRPMDCRLFPLDIEYKNGKYFWALFNNKRCNLTERDLQSLLEYRYEALEILKKDLHDYATMPVPGMNEIGYKTLMEIEI